MNILITGGLGAIGSWVTRQLIEQGDRAVTYSRHIDNTLVRDIVDKIEMVTGDIMDLPTLLHTIKKYKIQRICHLSAMLGELAQANPWLGFQVNAIGTLNVLEAARIMDVERVVFTSSIAVFIPFAGEHIYPTYKPITEEHPKYPTARRVGVYGTAKLASELLCLHYNQEFGLDSVVLHFCPLLGIARKSRGRGRITALHSIMVENAMLGKPTIIPRGGEEKTDLLYVKDAARSIVLACFAQNLKHHNFNIGTGKSYSLEDLASAIRKIYPEAVFEIGPGLDPIGVGNIYCVFDSSRARNELGYSPKFTLEEAVKDCVETVKWLDEKRS